MIIRRRERQEYQTINNWRPDKDANFYFVLGPYERARGKKKKPLLISHMGINLTRKLFNIILNPEVPL
jgi:hypothetical protein